MNKSVFILGFISVSLGMIQMSFLTRTPEVSFISGGLIGVGILFLMESFGYCVDYSNVHRRLKEEKENE